MTKFYRTQEYGRWRYFSSANAADDYVGAVFDVNGVVLGIEEYETTEEQLAIIAKLKAYANEHYNDGGWDVYVETYEATDWLELIDGRATYEAALEFAAKIASVWAERQADARHYANE